MRVVVEVLARIIHRPEVQVEQVVAVQVQHQGLVPELQVRRIEVVVVELRMLIGDNHTEVVVRVVLEQMREHLVVEHLRKRHLLQHLEQHIQLRLVRGQPLLAKQVTEEYQIKIHHLVLVVLV
jgi:hypothetical protein